MLFFFWHIEIKAFYPSRDTFYGYYRNEPASILKAIDQLHTYIGEEGPFEGVIGFSQGAALLSTYLIQWNNTWPERPFPVQCAIFFSASRPFDVPSLYAGQLQWVDVDACGALLSLPTAHIWGAKDETYKDQCELLSAMCAEEGREVYVHGEGHEIPGPRAKQDVQGCVRVIRRVIEKASLDV